MTATFANLVQPFAHWTFVKHLFKQLEPTIQDTQRDDLELDTFLKPHFDRGVFLNGSSSF